MSFEQLHVYQAAKRLTAMVDELTKSLPREFEADVKHVRKTLGQIEDAIAEACGQKTPGKMAYYLG
ncbi:MAG TPA: hypothetical protein VM100_12495, partial [Longimicrobiales bacterium]|nr:hypothetical protein [Longimicrobiales bacterium]